MRILVTGSRNWTDRHIVHKALLYVWELYPGGQDFVVVHGGAEGADSFAEGSARKIGYETEIHRPDYKSYPGWQAPLKRNDAMLDSGIDLVLAFMLGTPEKGGTKYTVDGAKRRGLPVILYNWPGDADFKG